jgi:hypothetical protein
VLSTWPISARVSAPVERSLAAPQPGDANLLGGELGAVAADVAVVGLGDVAHNRPAKVARGEREGAARSGHAGVGGEEVDGRDLDRGRGLQVSLAAEHLEARRVEAGGGEELVHLLVAEAEPDVVVTPRASTRAGV